MIEVLSRHMIASLYSMEKMRLSRKMIMQFIIDQTYSLIILGRKPFRSLYIMKLILFCTRLYNGKTRSSLNIYSEGTYAA